MMMFDLCVLLWIGNLVSIIFCSINEKMVITFFPSSDPVMTNIVKIQPKPSSSVTTGYTFCMRTKFVSWNDHYLLVSNHTRIQLRDYKIGNGSFVRGPYSYIFNWKQAMPVSVNNWNSMCFTYDTMKCSVMITINGFDIFSETKNQNQECHIGNISNYDITLGDKSFAGQITDFNFWNRPLTPEEMKAFCTSCTNDFVLNSKPELIYWPDANITFWGNSTEKQTIEEGFYILCKEDKLLSTDRFLFMPNKHNYESARKKCNCFNGELILPKEEDVDQIELKVKEFKLKLLCGKIWVPIIKVNTMDSIWVHETSNGTLLNISLPGLDQEDFSNEFKCIYYDLQSKQYQSTDCYQPDFPYCAICRISLNRLIFKVLSKSNVEWFLDDEYFLTNRMNQLAMFGIQGRTMILRQGRQWLIYNQMVKNDSLVGILNGTTMYPNGLQTISYTERNNVNASIQLKLSNVCFLCYSHKKKQKKNIYNAPNLAIALIFVPFPPCKGPSSVYFDLQNKLW